MTGTNERSNCIVTSCAWMTIVAFSALIDIYIKIVKVYIFLYDITVGNQYQWPWYSMRVFKFFYLFYIPNGNGFG